MKFAFSLKLLLIPCEKFILFVKLLKLNISNESHSLKKNNHNHIAKFQKYFQMSDNCECLSLVFCSFYQKKK